MTYGIKTIVVVCSLSIGHDDVRNDNEKILLARKVFFQVKF